jgi:hypothetical protein
MLSTDKALIASTFLALSITDFSVKVLKNGSLSSIA